jgi:hypothetical protein
MPLTTSLIHGNIIVNGTGWYQKNQGGLIMKKLVEDVQGEGLVALLGEKVTLFCAVYIYTGKLIGVNDTFVKLEDASIVYETGAFTDKSWKDAQKLPNELYVQTAMIESFGILK